MVLDFAVWNGLEEMVRLKNPTANIIPGRATSVKSNDMQPFEHNNSESNRFDQGVAVVNTTEVTYEHGGREHSLDDMLEAKSSIDNIHAVLMENMNSSSKREELMQVFKNIASSADRTNIMTKTHSDDLDLISELLTEKERDLELAAKIGQSLLQRNKALLLKMEAMEDYLSSAKDREAQLEYDLRMKSDMVKLYFREEDEIDDENREKKSMGSDGNTSYETYPDDVCQDEDMMLLSKRCKNLERENHNLFTEALSIRDLTEEVEEDEEELIFNCVNQLGDAKSQITQLTDEIAMKFEDNIQQQEEITQLITMVVELQKKQKQLSSENEQLQIQLCESQQTKGTLQDQLGEMQDRFKETFELLQHNQEELKELKTRMEMDGTNKSWNGEPMNNSAIQEHYANPFYLHTPDGYHHLRSSSSNSVGRRSRRRCGSKCDSIADEIEESVRAKFYALEDNRNKTQRVMSSVRNLNIPRVRSSADSYTTSGRTSPMSMYSLASDEWSESGRLTATSDLDSLMSKKKTPKKLQIVKPLEGSDTLHKWHHLASHSVHEGLGLTQDAASQRQSESSSSDEEITFRPNMTSHNTATTNNGNDTVDSASEIPSDVDTEIHAQSTAATETTPTAESIQLTPTVRKKAFTPSSARAKLTPGGGLKLGGLDAPSPMVKRTIITRNSSALRSVRDARKILRSGGELAGSSSSPRNRSKSKAEAIDLIASAMDKLNLETKAGERILKSVSASFDESQETIQSPTVKSPVSQRKFDQMPNVQRVLDKAAQERKNSSSEVPSLALTTPSVEEEPAENTNSNPATDSKATRRAANTIRTQEEPPVARATLFNNPLLKSSNLIAPQGRVLNKPNRSLSKADASPVSMLGFQRTYSGGNLRALQTELRSSAMADNPLDLSGTTGHMRGTVSGSRLVDRIESEGINTRTTELDSPSEFDLSATPTAAQPGLFGSFFSKTPSLASLSPRSSGRGRMLRKQNSADDITKIPGGGVSIPANLTVGHASSVESGLDQKPAAPATNTTRPQNTNSGGGGVGTSITSWLFGR